MEFKLTLRIVRVGDKKWNKQLSTIDNITKFYKSQEQVIKFYNDYFKIIHKATYIGKNGKGLKILTAEQNSKDYL